MKFQRFQLIWGGHFFAVVGGYLIVFNVVIFAAVVPIIVRIVIVFVNVVGAIVVLLGCAFIVLHFLTTRVTSNFTFISR